MNFGSDLLKRSKVQHSHPKSARLLIRELFYLEAKVGPERQRYIKFTASNLQITSLLSTVTNSDHRIQISQNCNRPSAIDRLITPLRGRGV